MMRAKKQMDHRLLSNKPDHILARIGRVGLSEQRFDKRPWLLRYGVAALAVAIAMGLKLLLGTMIVQDTPFLLVFTAILVSAWYGGLGPGLAATAVSAVITDYLFLPPIFSLSPIGINSVPLGVFVLQGVLFTFIITALRLGQYQALNSLVALYQSGQILGSTLKRDEIGARLLEIMQRVSNVSAAGINLRDAEGRLRVWHTVGPEELWRQARAEPEAQAACHEAAKTEEDKLFELRLPGPEARRIVGLCVPLKVRDRAVGVLEAYGPQALAEKSTVETLVSLANQAASALENSRLYEELGAREHQLQDLLSRVLVAQEDERHRVAYDIHDGLTQTAVAAYQHLQAFADDYYPASAQGQEELEETVELVRQTVRDARQVIADLRPTALDDFGLGSAIGMEIDKLRAEDYQLNYEDKLGDERLPVSVETALFRVAQEALTNIRKHAQASRVHLALRRLEQSVRLEVRDWGRGFDPSVQTDNGGPGERVGLSSMQERVSLLGGRLEVDSKPGYGTTVVAEVPLIARPPRGRFEREQ